MTTKELITKIKKRKQALNISIDNLAKLSNIGVRTLNRLMANEDVKLSTVEKVTNILGLDFSGNEVISIKTLKEQRAKEKAIFLASLVQSTSALEMQGLEPSSLNNIINGFKKELLKGKYKNKLWAV